MSVGVDLLGMLLYLLMLGAIALGLYWIIRLAVRHGMQDAKLDRRAAAPAARDTETPQQ